MQEWLRKRSCSSFGGNFRGKKLRCQALIMLLLFSAICLGSTLSAQTTIREELPSGLTVVHHPNDLTHTAVVRLMVEAAPRYEGELIGSGISNVLREILVQQWRARERLAIGPLTSATGVDRTDFTITTADTQLVQAIRELASVAAAGTINEERLESARRAVFSRMAVRENRLPTVARDAFARLLYRQHPARFPVTGLENQLAQLTVEDLQRYFIQRYSTPRMTLVVVGNISRAELRETVSTAFAPFATGQWAAPAPIHEPDQFSRRHRVQAVELDIEQERHLYGWRLRPITSAEQPALALIAKLLNNSESMLVDRFSSEKIATDLTVTHHVAGDRPGYFLISYSPYAGKGADAWVAIQDILADLSQQITDAQLNIAKRHFRRDYLEQIKTSNGLLETIAHSEVATGMPDYWSHRFVKRVHAVSAEDASRAAREWLRPTATNRLSVVLRAASEAVVSPGGKSNVHVDVPPELIETDNQVRLLTQWLPTGTVTLGLHVGGGEGVIDGAIAGAAGVWAECLSVGTPGLARKELQFFSE